MLSIKFSIMVASEKLNSCLKLDKKMTLEQAYFITQIFIGFGFIVSIAFLAVQMRQNSYLLRKQMADQRLQRTNWMTETMVLDPDFRKFERRINTEYDTFNLDEKYRENMLGVRVVVSILNELLAHFDGQISDDEWINLQWNMGHAPKRPHIQAAYLWVKDGYAKKIQEYWEALDTSGVSHQVDELAR
jgi:hypothetical protein